MVDGTVKMITTITYLKNTPNAQLLRFHVKWYYYFF